MVENCSSQNTNGLSKANLLNTECYCKTLDRQKLAKLLPDRHPAKRLLQQQSQLFSDTAVYISSKEYQQIQNIVQAVETMVTCPLYQQRILADAPNTAQMTSHTGGAFNAIDFHMSNLGPRIIEVNTNGGGAFLNSALIAAQIACCDVNESQTQSLYHTLDTEFVSMLKNEWRLERGQLPLKTIAIVDDKPEEQFLYPELLMAQHLFENAGIQTYILSPEQMTYDDTGLYFNGTKLDLIYNRLTDFYFSESTHQHIKKSYLNRSVVVTPNPFHYALYANKQHLIHMSDPEFLASLSLTTEIKTTLLNAAPQTQRVTAESADDLWQNRKHLFFKPMVGFGSRATYRGDKLTQKVWTEIVKSDYVAQQFIPPSIRAVEVNNETKMLKMDIRAYIYQGRIQLLAARLYQGQTTNFRTPGGGFAPVWVVADI